MEDRGLLLLCGAGVRSRDFRRAGQRACEWGEGESGLGMRSGSVVGEGEGMGRVGVG